MLIALAWYALTAGELHWLLIAGWLGAVIASTVAAVRAGQRSSAEIAMLIDATREFSRGNYAHRLEVTREDEVGDLSRAFDELGASIEASNQVTSTFAGELMKQVELDAHKLKEAQDQLLRSQRLAAVGDLAAGFAHEINNPLTGVIGNAALLKSMIPPELEGREMLDEIIKGGQRIAEIIRNLTALAESQRGGMRPLDLHSVVEKVLDGPAAASVEGLAVSRNFSASLRPILGDEASIQNLFLQLLNNSASALKDRTEKTISISTEMVSEDAVRIEVTDTGCGIPRGYANRLFNPFFTTKQSWEGKGLGLAVCYRVVQSHGGKIDLKSEEGVGTTVTLVFPTAPSGTVLK